MQPRHLTPDVSDEDRGTSPAGSTRGAASRRRSTRGTSRTRVLVDDRLTGLPTACDQCRRTKSKCERSEVDNVCRACAAMGVCEYTRTTRTTLEDADRRLPQLAPMSVSSPATRRRNDKDTDAASQAPATSVAHQKAISSPSNDDYTKSKRCSAPSSAQTTLAHAGSSRTSQETSSPHTLCAGSR